MIANVSLKFSLVKTKIVLSPNHCWTKLCYLLSSCPLENILQLPSPLFMLNWVRGLPRQISSLYRCSLLLTSCNKGGLVWSESNCLSLLFISLPVCHLWFQVKQLGTVSVKEVLFSFMKRLLSFYLCNRDKILKNIKIYLSKEPLWYNFWPLERRPRFI